MNNKKMIKEIKRSWSFCKAAKLDPIFSNPIPMTADKVFKDICRDPNATYEQVFLMGLKERQYNIILFDYSFLQFSGKDEDSIRYAYYPNPFLGASNEALAELADLQEYVTEGVISFEEFLQSISEIRNSQHPPLLRYENSYSQYKENTHPCSHFHFGHHADNRWSLKRILTPGAFCLIIIKHFYRDFWDNSNNIKNGSKEFSLDVALVESKKNSRILSNEFFSKLATDQFFFD
jgi:hypothetical protein